MNTTPALNTVFNSPVSNLFDTFFEDWPLRTNGDQIYKGPRFDMIEENSYYQILVDLPGALKENINLEVEDNTLNLTVDYEDILNKKYIHRNRKRKEKLSLKLPKKIDVESMNAKLENGVLDIVVNKIETSKKLDIKVN